MKTTGELSDIILSTVDSALFECNRMTSGNFAHLIASIKQLLMLYKEKALECKEQ